MGVDVGVGVFELVRQVHASDFFLKSVVRVALGVGVCDMVRQVRASDYFLKTTEEGAWV